VLGRIGRVLTILAVVAAAGWGVWTYVVPHRTDVPRLREMTVARAQAAAEEASLELVVAREAFSSEVDAGLIVSQRPPPGAVIDQGSEVRVVLSKGPELVVVPDVTGMRLPRARERIADARLEIDVERVFDREVPEGRVVDQNPLATTEIEVGKTVVVRVSRGPQPVDVPNVVGSAAGDAEALLEAAGFQVSRSQDFSDSVPRGSVIAQSPEAGTRLPVGNTVEIVLSKGPEEFPMPRVVGMSEQEARNVLTGRGLRVKTVDIPTGKEGEVVGQRPRPGTTVESGQQVTIYVGSG
jgi:serine/threonine-protein kinase